MEELKRKRPMLATLLCIATALWMVYSLYQMLHVHHSTLRHGAVLMPMAAPWYRHTMFGINFILGLGGIISLWLMRPVAAVFYAGRIVTSVINMMVQIFYLHIFQTARALFTVPSRPDAHISMPIWASWVITILAIVFTVVFELRFFCMCGG